MAQKFARPLLIIKPKNTQRPGAREETREGALCCERKTFRCRSRNWFVSPFGRVASGARNPRTECPTAVRGSAEHKRHRHVPVRCC